MNIQLFFTNIDFAIKIFAALVLFATGWLHWGSWSLEKKDKLLLARSIGFFLLCFVSVWKASTIETEILIFSSQILKISGLVLILVSLLNEPVLHPPIKETALISLVFVSQIFIPLSGMLYLIIGLTYLKKSTSGYEKQIKPLFFAFLFLALAEITDISFLAKNLQTVFWSNLLANYGPIWIISQISKLIGFVILGIWTWGYLRFRAQAQLFITFVTITLFIFTITTFSFTFILSGNLENNALDHLKTDVKTLQYGVDRLQSEALADAKTISENSTIKEAIRNNDSEKLFNTTVDFMLSQNTSFLEVTDNSGKVIMRASDNEKIGDSLISDITVKSALDNKPIATVALIENVVAPEVQIRASQPISDNGSIIGVVVTGFNIDSAFVDGIKSITGLDTSVYSGNIRSATTFVSPDGKSRSIGTKENDSKILSTVLQNDEVYIGPNEILNQPFLTAYSPLKTADDKVVGMLFVGRLQTEIVNISERSIQLTFLGSTILMILSTLPAYFLARRIKENIKA